MYRIKSTALVSFIIAGLSFSHAISKRIQNQCHQIHTQTCICTCVCAAYMCSLLNMQHLTTQENSTEKKNVKRVRLGFDFITGWYTHLQILALHYTAKISSSRTALVHWNCSATSIWVSLLPHTHTPHSCTRRQWHIRFSACVCVCVYTKKILVSVLNVFSARRVTQLRVYIVYLFHFTKYIYVYSRFCPGRPKGIHLVYAIALSIRARFEAARAFVFHQIHKHICTHILHTNTRNPKNTPKQKKRKNKDNKK